MTPPRGRQLNTPPSLRPWRSRAFIRRADRKKVARMAPQEGYDTHKHRRRLRRSAELSPSHHNSRHLASNLWILGHDSPFCDLKNTSLVFFNALAQLKGLQTQRLYFLFFYQVSFIYPKIGLKRQSWPLIFPKLSKCLTFNEYVLPKMILWIFASKQWHRCSSNLNYFLKISINSF